ncbi:hypothetical protein ELI15_17165 [Rhizobium ruizarguesonis]|nr:hypothetical protein ELI15_17165 [Rhizobium ruizarguesonis]
MNIHAENFYRDYLNLALGHALENTNLFRANFPAIDLADKKARICMQVTSSGGAAKVRHTVKQFKENKLYDQYDRLVVLVLGDAASKSGKFQTFDNGTTFDPSKDVWDKNDLLAQVNGMDDERMQACADYLDRNVRMPDREPVPREVKTIIKLFEFICSQELDEVEEFTEKPDPTRKVYKRFADYSDLLMNQYTDLYPEFGRLFDEVVATLGLSSADVRHVHRYLKIKSDRRLMECDGKPLPALDLLVSDLSTLLARAHVDYVEGAVQFFLLAQLIECNVFPNRDEVDA